MQENAMRNLHQIILLLHFSILSDMKKTTAVVESLSTTSTRCSVTEITSLLQAGSIHLFKITGKIMMDKVILNKYYIWDVLEIDWSKVKVTLNGKVINLSKSITVRLWDKFKLDK